MIGSESFTVRRPDTYLLSSAPCVDKVPTAQPPTGGCYIRAEGTGTVGTVVITGTVGGSTTSETISTFDSEKVGFGTLKFTAISKVIITGFSNLILYGASESGERIKLISYTTFNILADCYDRFLSEQSGQYTEFAGFRNKNYKTLLYDGRFTLQKGDLITILGEELTVADVSSQHGLYSSLLVSTRGK
jgi:hypothetical protein